MKNFQKSPLNSSRDVLGCQIHLSLANKNLSEFSQIRQYKNLVDLDLSENQFSAQFPELLFLRFLIKLNLSSNSISKIYALNPQLEYLDLSNNKIKDINNVLPKLEKIIYLNLSNNLIKNVAEFAGNKIEMKQFLISNNQLQTLQSFDTFTSLQSLDIQNNQISNVQEFILLKDLTQLLEIQSAGNQIKWSDQAVQQVFQEQFQLKDNQVLRRVNKATKIFAFKQLEDIQQEVNFPMQLSKVESQKETEELINLKEQLSQAQLSLKKMQQNFELASQSLDQTQKNLDSTNTTLLQVKSQSIALEEENKQLKEEKEKMINQMKEMENLNLELKQIRLKEKESEAQNIQLRQQLQQLTSKNKLIAKQNKEINLLLNQYKQQWPLIEDFLNVSDIDQIQEPIEKMKEEFQQLNEMNQMAQEDIFSQVLRKNIWKFQFQKQKTLCKNLQEKINTFQDLISVSQKIVDKNKVLEANVQRLELRNKQMKEEFANYKIKFQSLKKQSQLLESELQENSERFAVMIKEMQNKKKTNIVDEEEKTERAADANYGRDFLKQVLLFIDKMKSKNKYQKQQIKQLEMQRDQLFLQINPLSTMNKQIAGRNKILNMSAQTARASLKQLQILS